MGPTFSLHIHLILKRMKNNLLVVNIVSGLRASFTDSFITAYCKFCHRQNYNYFRCSTILTTANALPCFLNLTETKIEITENNGNNIRNNRA